MPKAKFNEAAVKKMVTLLKGKKPVIEIAKIMKTTPATVRSCLVKAGEYKVRKMKRSKKAKVVRQAVGLALEAIYKKLIATRLETKRLERLLKKTIKREEMKFKKKLNRFV